MSFTKNDFMKIIRTLSMTHRSNETKDIGRLWQAGVMAEIGRIGPLRAGTNFFMFSDNFMWRFVPTACLLIVVMSFILSNGAFDPEYEITKFFFNDPIEYAVSQLWGV
jgi:hypothetical protein